MQYLLFSVTFYVMCFYARLLVCNTKALIYMQSITPLHANTTKHAL